MGKPKNTIWDLFSKIDPEGGLKSCWNWTGSSHTDGYGLIRYQGKKHKAHRLLYQHLCNYISQDKVVRHICDNPACCNPTHLLEGTQADNIKDMYERKRARVGINPSKLSRKKIEAIHKLRKEGLSFPDIAKKVGCSIASAHRYATGKVI